MTPDGLLAVGKTKLVLNAYCKVKSKPKKGIVVPKLKMTEPISATYDTKWYTITFTSKDKKVASVSEKGVVKGLKAGNTTIVVKLFSKTGKKELVASRNVAVTVKPTIYVRHLIGKKYIRNGGKKFTKRRGVQFKIVGMDKPFYLFFKSGNKKYGIYTGKKWKKKIKSIPKEKNTWIPLSGKQYQFYISANKKGKEADQASSNVIKWKV